MVKKHLTFKDLVSELSFRTGLPKTLCSFVIRDMVEIIEDVLKIDGEIAIKRFGQFKTIPVKPYKVKFKKEYQVPSYKRIMFKCSRKLFEAVNKK